MSTSRAGIRAGLVVLAVLGAAGARGDVSPATGEAGPVTGLEACAPSGALAGELVEPRDLGGRCGGDAECWGAGLERARATRDRYPDQYDAHRAYVLSVRAAGGVLGKEAAARVAAEYADLAERHPEEPAWVHLRGQLALDGADYQALLEDLVTHHPDYPWAHLSLAFQDGRPGATDEERQRAKASLERFVALCPDRLVEPARALEMIGDAELAKREGERLRRLARERGDGGALAVLWPLAVRLLPEDGRETGVAAIRDELAAFAGSVASESLAGLQALLRGYLAVGDDAARSAAEDRLLESHPCVDDAIRVRDARFRAAHPVPQGEEKPESRAAIDAALAALDEESARCPGDELAARTRVAFLESASSARDADLLAAIDRYLALPGRRIPLVPSEPGWLARLYLDRGLRLERVPGLIEQDAAEARAARDRAVAAGGPNAEPQYGYRERETLRLKVRYALARGDVAGARGLLGELAAETAKAPGGGRERVFAGLSLYPDERTRLDQLEARVRIAEGRPQAALDLLARLVPDEPLGPAVREDAVRAWRALHGSADGFDTWATALANGLDSGGGWTVVDRPLPAVELRDFGGGVWDWSALEGRTILVTVWATWCAPCRDLVTRLGGLLERWGDPADRAIVALNVDRSNSALIPFLSGTDIAVPVLMGGDPLFDGGLEGVPVSWIVSPAGRIVRQRVGFDGDPGSWLAAAADELEKVAAESAPAPPAAPAGAADSRP